MGIILKKFIVIIIVIIFSAKLFLYWQNDTVGVTNYTIINEKIPSNFDGYKIIQLSDIQGKEFGLNNKDFISKIVEEKADMIALTGDLIQEGLENSPDIISFLLKNVDLPKEIYAVSGNHDYWNSKQFNEYQNMMKKLGVKLIENTSTNIYKDNEKITIHGIADPISFDNKEAEGISKTGLSKLKISDGYNILLFHRANMLDLFKNEKFDLIVSGHLHGGQVRIPFVGGLKSPHGDWFPKYSGGRYDVNNNTYIVSRGIGNPFIVPRVFNRPEIVVITLKKYK